MKRPFMALVVGCAVLIGVVALRPPGFRRVLSVSEYDGSRSIQERYLGLVTWVRSEADPGLDVTGDLRRELARRGFSLLVPLQGPFTRNLKNGYVEYAGSVGPVKSAKNVVDDAARQLVRVRRTGGPYAEEVLGHTRDGGAILNVFVAKSTSTTSGMLFLSIPPQPHALSQR